MVCPYCTMQAGWNEKRKVWDGVQIIDQEEPNCLQYAHQRCLPVSARQESSMGPTVSS
jgi:hypothetical protein